MSAEEVRARIVIIGGGVVGCALFRRFALGGLDPLLIEAAPDLLAGASKGNSALLHTGFDAPPDSLELACIQAGYREYLAIRASLNLPLIVSGALVIAWNEREWEELPRLLAQAIANGVQDGAILDRAELRRREPHLAPEALGALHIPGEAIIDPWSAPLAYAHQGLAHGGRILRRCRIIGGDFDGIWRLRGEKGERIDADIVVNAAGNYGDIVEAIGRPAHFAIRPRKGQFVVFDKPAAKLANAILLPVPNERTKGVVLFRTAFGNLAVGPTAEDQEDRSLATVESGTLADLVRLARERLPALAGIDVTATYAGLRPATQFKDYRIESLKERRWITVAGIRSTGLTGALGIAAHVADLYRRDFGPLIEAEPIATPMPNLCEARPRPYLGPAGGDIVCHCESVTRDEIEAALRGPLPAGDLGGLKRRTRAMMGRCQGFYCAARIASLSEGRFA